MCNSGDSKRTNFYLYPPHEFVCFVCMHVCYLLKFAFVSLLFETTLKAERKTLPTRKLMPIALTRVSVRSNYKVVYIVNTMHRAHDYHHYLYANRATTLRPTNAHIYCSQFQHPDFSPRTPLPVDMFNFFHLFFKSFLDASRVCCAQKELRIDPFLG